MCFCSEFLEISCHNFTNRNWMICMLQLFYSENPIDLLSTAENRWFSVLFRSHRISAKTFTVSYTQKMTKHSTMYLVKGTRRSRQANIGRLFWDDKPTCHKFFINILLILLSIQFNLVFDFNLSSSFLFSVDYQHRTKSYGLIECSVS